MNVVNIWGPNNQRSLTPVSSPRITILPKAEETEATVRFLKTQTINYLRNLGGIYRRSLKIELPHIKSGTSDGSIFSATKIWNKIYLGIERKNDRSADTASIRWISIKTENFQNLLENSLRKMLIEDAPLLRQRARLRNDFWNTLKGGLN